VIIVVEGASGAGKTTWCRTHAGANALLEALPDQSVVPTDPAEAARFWVERNVARWQEVLAREAHDGLVVVDTDPFKLHYVWTLFRTGQAGELDWTMQRNAARDAFSSGRYALADAFLVSDIDAATLRARRESDFSRVRGNFERHVLLRDSLLRWYSAIDRLEPGRVVFGLPAAGLSPELVAKGKRARGSGPELFDELMTELAGL
jgi:hypothetical protein